MLIGDRDDHAGDQRPVRVELGENDRLDVEAGLVTIAVDADVAVPVELERDADQRSHRIGELLGQVGARFSWAIAGAEAANTRVVNVVPPGFRNLDVVEDTFMTFHLSSDARVQKR